MEGPRGRIRQTLIEENLLDAVVGLPANLFTTTGIPVAILVFDRSREQGGANEARRRHLVSSTRARSFSPGKTQNVMDKDHIAKVLATYRVRATVDKYSQLVSPEEIAHNGHNLNIPRYVDTFEPEEEIDVAAVQIEIVADRVRTSKGAGEDGSLPTGARGQCVTDGNTIRSQRFVRP